MVKSNLASILRRVYVRIAVKLWRMGLVSLMEFAPGMGLDEIKAEYSSTLYNAMADYLGSNRPITAFRNQFARAVNDAFTLAFYAGWADGGADGPLPDTVQSWLNGRIEQEISYANELFTSLKQLRDNREVGQDDKLTYAQTRADGYTSTLDGIYNEGKMRADPFKIGIWHLGPTHEHCSTCAGLNGQSHPLAWYIENGYIPQEPGSSQLECGGWNCLCTIDSEDGEQLIP